MRLLDSLRKAFALPPAAPPVYLAPETRTALAVQLMDSVGNATHLYRLADHAANHDPFGGLMAERDKWARHALATKLRGHQPVTVDEVLVLAYRDANDPLNAALIRTVFLQPDLQGLQGWAPPADASGPPSAADGPRRLL